MASYYLLMRSGNSNSKIEVDSDEFCQDHRKDPPQFHTVRRKGYGDREYVYAVRCPTSLSPEERRRLFASDVPMHEAAEIMKAHEGSKKEKAYRDLGAVLAALAIWGIA